MIRIVSRYTLDRKIFMENPDWSEWVTNSLCENLMSSYTKERVPELSVFIVI